jgi:CheY-like chemotaxis protein
LNPVIFSPGFSTYTTHDQTAGRGIGLDIVADSIASLKGKVSVESSPGEGTHFTIRLPVKVISEQGLVVRQGEQQWAISSRGIEQVLFLEPEQLERPTAGWRYQYDNSWLNVYPIAALVKIAVHTPLSLAQHRALLIMETWPGQRAAVLVEQVLASKDMVVKPLTPYTPAVSGVISATILGDGQVAPVLDMQHLLMEALSLNINFSESFTQLADARPQKSHRPLALVVDDSLSTRRAVAQVVSDFGMEVHTAKDGFEAVDMMRDKVPDIVLLDMEMPRMNGLELTAHIRSNEPTRHVPVVMITSRNTGKHRHLAEAAGVNSYLSKPFLEDELVEYLQYSIRH